jgi:hypothetical protein
MADGERTVSLPPDFRRWFAPSAITRSPEASMKASPARSMTTERWLWAITA